MAEKKFSLAIVAATAVVTFLVSGVGGAALSEWLSRPIPLVTISSVGFAGSEAQVAIGDGLMSSTNESPWTRSYRKFESFSSMEEDYVEVDLTKKRLERGLASVNGWLKANEATFESPAARLNLDQISNTPCMMDEIVPAALVGMARRGELQGAPVALAALARGEPVTEIIEADSGWIIYLRNRNVMFPKDSSKTETEKAAIKLLAYSFAYGNGLNIVHYLKRFQAASNEDIRKLMSMKEELEKAMMPSTKLAVAGSIFNSGRKPLVIKPYALLTVLNEDIENKRHIVNVEVAHQGDTFEDFVEEAMEGDKGSSSEDVIADAFLPPAAKSGYILVGPNSKVDVRLISVDQLGTAGAHLRSIYNSNVLRCQITMLSASGEELNSDALLFGSSMDKDLRTELLGARSEQRLRMVSK